MGIYKIWSSMIQRCTNERNAKYPQYGGRGITVCDRWRDFDLFYSDVGDKPFPGATIDRIENDAGYGPGNFRWASRKEQQRNRRSNHRLTFNGATKCLAEWEEETGVKSNTILTRIRRNWPVGEALGLLPHEQKQAWRSRKSQNSKVQRVWLRVHASIWADQDRDGQILRK